MIESFDKVQLSNSIFCSELTILPKDTLVIQFDQDVWDLDSANQIASHLIKNFPNNNIITIFKGMELGVIHHEN